MRFASASTAMFAVNSQNPMLQCWQLLANFPKVCKVDIAFHNASPLLTLLGQHVSPRTDKHAVTPRLASMFMDTSLCRSEYLALIFHSACAQQQLPVGTPCGVRKGAGNDQEIHALRRLLPEQLRKAQVIADT